MGWLIADGLQGIDVAYENHTGRERPLCHPPYTPARPLERTTDHANTRQQRLIAGDDLASRGRVLRVIARILVVFMIVAAGACDDDSPTTPTTTADPPAAVAVTETFEETVPVGGSTFYSFTVPLNGTVEIRLANVGGAGVPATVWLGVGIGAPSGTDCTTTTVVNTAAGETPQITGTYSPGVYCAKVADIGNLLSPARFTVLIGHP